MKRLEKNYIRPAAADGLNSVSTRENQATDDISESLKNDLIAKLRIQYGESIRYIVKNAKSAVDDLEKKLGSEKARQLQQHTDSCRSWARNLKLMTEEELEEIEKLNDSDGANNELNKPVQLSLSSMQCIEKHLKTRVGNIRSYVVKHADPDQFLLETLQSKDKLFAKNHEASNLFRKALLAQINSQRDLLQKHEDHLSKSSMRKNDSSSVEDNFKGDPIISLQRTLEKALATVPPLTRNDNDSSKIEASLRHLEKMRAASTAMMTYWTLKGDERFTMAPRDTLKKIHSVVRESTKFVLSINKELEKKQRRQKQIVGCASNCDREEEKNVCRVFLQDAWTKTIELPSYALELSTNGPSNKRLRTDLYRPYYRVQNLFQTKLPHPSLLSAIRRKGAKLVLPENKVGANSVHLVLDLKEVFTMTVYLSPLTAALRAKDCKLSSAFNESCVIGSGSNINSVSVAWLPLCHGLIQSSNNGSDSFMTNSQQQQKQVSIWGVTSTYGSIGRVIEERLRDASTHATATLRKCFQIHVKEKVIDFEVELLEGSALLAFLDAVRLTYMPNMETL